MAKVYARRMIVDLGCRSYRIDQIEETHLREYLGARGLNGRYLLEHLDTSIAPLDPRNPLIFGSGLLSGSLFPACGRYNVTARSPLTGIFGDANSGGFWGPELTFAGFDQLVVTGASEKPVYLLIDNDKVKFVDAAQLWGKDTWETDITIRRDCGENTRMEIAAIGPAGENLVKYACIMNNLARAAGRTGMGAVMGSKKLKAIAVRGSNPVKKAVDTELHQATAMEILSLIRKAPAYEIRSTYGTTLVTDAYQRMGILPTRNGQYGIFEKAENIGAQAISKYVTRHKSCFACPVHCSRYFHVNEGRFAGTYGEGPEYETICAFGSRCDNSDLESIFYINSIVNKLGLDSISLGGVLSFLMEAREKGLIKPEFTDGIDLSWGNTQAMIDIIKKVAVREGCGDILAEGVRTLSGLVPGTEGFAHHIKGLEPPEQDPRGRKAMGLGWSVSSRGACHLRTYPVAESHWTEQDALRVLGRRVVTDRLSYVGKPDLVKWSEEFSAVCDSLGLCKLVYMALSIPLEHIAKGVNSITGWDMDAQELLGAGERVVNLERIFNARYGISRKDDRLPPRYANEPIPEGPSKGHVCDLEPMLDGYYEARGWTQSGFPKDQKVLDLGLDWTGYEEQEYNGRKDA